MRSDKASERSDMSTSVEAQGLIRSCAEPVRAGESVKALIRKAARKTGLSFGRARSLWYAEARVVRADEMDALRRAANSMRAVENGRAEDADLRSMLAEISRRLDSIEQSLARSPD